MFITVNTQQIRKVTLDPIYVSKWQHKLQHIIECRPQL